LGTAKKIFEGLGPGNLVPQRGKLAADQLGALGDKEGFVLSRVDGHTSLEEICLLVPFDEPTTMVILRRLWELGAIEVPGVARKIVPPPSGDSLPSVGGLKRRPPDVEALAPPISLQPGPGPATPPDGLGEAAKKRIDEFFSTLDQRDAFQLLEIERSADDKTVKRAYFKLSKEFHPDRFFGKEIGEYKDRLSRIFQAVKAAFEVLSDKKRREAYEGSVGPK